MSSIGLLSIMNYFAVSNFLLHNIIVQKQHHIFRQDVANWDLAFLLITTVEWHFLQQKWTSILASSLIPRPRPAFCRLQRSRAGRAWERDYLGRIRVGHVQLQGCNFFSSASRNFMGWAMHYVLLFIVLVVNSDWFQIYGVTCSHSSWTFV